ncbi:MAG: AraC family transcriptional regulator [Lachnospiraceae bacterium]|nr:AraC family transcriptional regulator [Lachnospiraceae bacterium]
MITINVYDDQREIKRHGTYAFPLAVYHYVMSDCMPGYINWHWHEEIQLTLVTKGAIRFFADGQQYLLQEGEGFFINSGRLHMARPETDPDSSYLCLDFHPRLLSSFSGSVFEEKYVMPYMEGSGLNHLMLDPRQPEDSMILQLVKEIAALCEEASFGYEMKVQAKVGQLWLALILRRTPEEIGALSRNHDTAQEMIRFLQTHYQDTVSLTQVARAVGFSESECCRLFKRVTGETILSYLKSYRLTRSIELLEETDLSISQIAYESGFSGASYYIESFRRVLHQTPLQYRKEHKRAEAANS